jgi:acyl-CoA synthetase (AMP-forming)/AMP-acid ligase II
MPAQIFPISPRISPEAIYHLLKITSCHRMLIVGANPVVDAVRRLLADEKYAMEFLELPPLEKFYPSLGAATPAQEQKFERLPLPDPNAYARGVVIYMHTSGSTSLPKPIGWTHEYIHLTVHIGAYTLLRVSRIT